MTPETFSRMRGLFDAAMALPAGVRRAFVESHLPPDDPLRAELLAMVDAGDDSGFLAQGEWGGAAAVLNAEGLDAEGLDAPAQIGRYRILRVLGRGGMGIVYLALRDDDVFQKVVALKVIGEKGAAQAEYVQRFRQERQILAGLDHPNVARILDGGDTDDGRPFYVMEYIAGVPIDEYCRQTAADIPARVRMVIEACQAVDYLHSHAIAHRDIKPDNILVAPNGRVKLVDFGVATVDTLDGMVPKVSRPGQPTLVMTAGYASPEQVSGKSGKSGDIYSLGVVLYELLTGRLPFVDEEGRANITAQLAGGDPAPPSREWKEPSVAGVPTTRTATGSLSRPDLDRVVLTALHRDPLRRYATVSMFAEDLRRCLDGRPIIARPESLIYRFRKLLIRNRIAASFAALLVAAAVLNGWISVEARIDRARIDAKEVEVLRFIAMLKQKVEEWPDKAVSEARKVADVQAAGQFIASSALRTLSAQSSNPARVKRMVSDLRQVLDKADTLSAGAVRVRKELTLVYRLVGDFEANPSQPHAWNRQGATESYRRAATIAAGLSTDDPTWAEGQITDLARLLRALGSPLDVQLARAPAPAPVPAQQAAARTEPAAPPADTLKPAAFRPPVAKELSPNDVSARDDLARRLRNSTTKAGQARINLESLRARLAVGGQGLRADLMTAMSNIDALLEEAKGALDLNDLPTAEDHLQRADYELRKLWQSVGS